MIKQVFAAFCVLALLSAFVLAASPVLAAPKALFVQWRGETDCDRGLKEGLKELGINLEIVEFNPAQDKEKLAAFLETVNPSDYAFIYTFSTTATMMTAQKIKTTPIIFGVVSAPVESGIIQSWEKPGGNVTGISHLVPFPDQVNLIGKLGSFKKLGLIYNQAENNSQIAKKELGNLLPGIGMTLIEAPVTDEAGIDAALAKLKAEGADLVYLPSDSFILTNGGKIVGFLNQNKIPTYAALEKYVTGHGAMVGIVSSYRTVGRELAGVVDQVLKGKSPSDIPARTLPQDMQTILVDGKTVQALGIEIPYSILEVAKVKE